MHHLLLHRKSDGIPEVKMALRSYLASRDRDAPGRRGTAIVSWRSNVTHSPRLASTPAPTMEGSSSSST